MLKFLKIQEKHLALILNWRTRPDVTQFMFSDMEHDLEKQKQWHRDIQADETSRYWIISYQDKLIGMIYLTDVDLSNRQCAWGYYIGEASNRMIGGIIPPYLFNYVFHQMGCSKICAEIMEGNENAIKLNEMFGFKLVARHENHIHKYGKDHDVFVYELLDSTWSSSNKYKRFVAEFEELNL